MERLISRTLFTGFSALLFLVAWVFTLTGQYFLAAIAFPVPVALLLARGETARCLGVGLVAVLAAMLGSAEISTALAYLLAAGAGVLLGLAFRRRWTFGRCVAATTAFVSALTGTFLALNYGPFRAESQAALAEWAEVATRQSSAAKEESMAIFFNWLSQHWDSLAAGMVFSQVLLMVTLAAGLCALWLRHVRPEAAPSTSFREMRMPEWLVWPAILAAVLLIIDQQWPQPVLRLISWNAAVALSTIYFLNGLAIVVYGLVAVRANTFFVAALFILLVYVWAHPMLTIIGFFDTWGEFRQKLDRLAAAISAREQSDDQ
ncbi:MAG: DUF2232 domain-containing protein [Candidatus Hydrogenedentes bacterium]|nr:DUF2232 domain-containing protein [Candidatus Hydrogenedentota bacterium]